MKKNKLFVAIISIFFLTGCANYNVYQYSKNPLPAPIQPNSEKVSRLFMIGDAGAINDHSTRTLSLLEKMVKSESGSAKVFFLGDNVYPRGMENDSFERKRASEILDFQADRFKDFKDDIVFLPGNHDWDKGQKNGLKNLKRQASYLKDTYAKNIRMLPKKGCPGPEVIELGSNGVVIIMDSQWWLQDWDVIEAINDKCEIRTRLDFIASFKETVAEHKSKQIFVVMHHPLYSNGSHGGKFSFGDHLFPLTKANKSLVLPLPVIGSIYPILRGTLGNIQDINHQSYQEFKRQILAVLSGIEDVIFVAGHEHSLQYQSHDGHHYVVSGSGAKKTPLKKNNDLLFGHAAAGFFTLDYYENGQTHMQAWAPTDDGNGKMIFEKLINPEPRIKPPVKIEIDQKLLQQDSTIAFVSKDYNKKASYAFLMGELYRNLYSIPVKTKVLNLDQEKGGLSILKAGGGQSTKSLRARSEDGQQYVLRGLNKDASGLLPSYLHGSVVFDLMQDQLTAAHPYAAFIIPGLAEAAGVYHTNPELRYLPAQESLGAYNEKFSGGLYLFEERPNGDGSKIQGFGGSKKIISSADAIEDILHHHDHFADYRFIIRSRLFDMFLGDWDRHDDQWRWATFKEGDKTIYRPIPRDRDQAFSEYDGFIPQLAYSYLPTVRKLGPFKEDITRLKWFNYNARYFDRFFLNQASESDWIEVAEELQAGITDADIDKAIAKWPSSIKANYASEISRKLKIRRTHIKKWALEFYAFLSKEVEIVGTNDKDLFEVTRNDDGSTKVEMYEWKKGEKRGLQFARTFNPSVTKQIRLFGLEDDDIVQFLGERSSGIPIIVVGGDGKDRFEDDTQKTRSRVKIYDEHRKDNKRNNFAQGTKYVEIAENEVQYERNSFKYSFGLPQFKIGLNPDEGFILGFGYQRTNQGFRKSPFSSRHTIDVSYSFGNNGFRAGYKGEFMEAIGKSDFVISALTEGPSYVQNFFGIGNETIEIDRDLVSNKFYRVIHNRYGIYPSIRKRFSHDKGAFNIQLLGERVSIEKTAGRFISQTIPELDTELFDGKNYGGGSLSFHYSQKNHPTSTTRGISFFSEVGVRSDFIKGRDMQRFLKSNLSFYHPVFGSNGVVFATRVGYETNGGDFDFFNGASLSGLTSMRGIANNRLIGNSIFYQNLDLRFRLIKFSSYVFPGSFGLVLQFDHGRIWAKNENSDTWHYSYGGGIWLSPLSELVISANYNVSDLDKRFAVKMGFFF